MYHNYMHLYLTLYAYIGVIMYLHSQLHKIRTMEEYPSLLNHGLTHVYIIMKHMSY